MNYKKSRIFRLLLMLCIVQISFAFAGCEKEPEQPENHTLDSIAKDGVTAVEPPEGKQTVNGMEYNYTAKESQVYNFETDYNNQMLLPNRVTDVKSGIVIGDDELLVFNKSTKKGQIFCGRPDCSHLSTECMSSTESMDTFQYYNGEIYGVSSLTTGLQKRSLDAVTSDSVGRLLTVDQKHVEGDNRHGTTCNWIIHRGYIYYIYFYRAGFDEDAYYLNNSNCLFRKPLEGGGEPECIMPLTKGINPWECYLSAAGSYIYIGMKKSADGSERGINIYRYNTETDMVENFQSMDENILFVRGTEDGFYYLKNENGDNGEIYFYDNMEHKKQKIIEIKGNVKSLRMDEDYMYMGKKIENRDDSYIGIYDYSGNEIHAVKLGFKDPEEGEGAYIRKYYIGFKGSDDDYIYFDRTTYIDDDSYNIWGMPDDGYQELMAIDKSKLKEGKIEYEIWGK